MIFIITYKNSHLLSRSYKFKCNLARSELAKEVLQKQISGLIIPTPRYLCYLLFSPISTLISLVKAPSFLTCTTASDFSLFLCCPGTLYHIFAICTSRSILYPPSSCCGPLKTNLHGQHSQPLAFTGFGKWEVTYRRCDCGVTCSLLNGSWFDNNEFYFLRSWLLLPGAFFCSYNFSLGSYNLFLCPFKFVSPGCFDNPRWFPLTLTTPLQSHFINHSSIIHP